MQKERGREDWDRARSLRGRGGARSKGRVQPGGGARQRGRAELLAGSSSWLPAQRAGAPGG